MGFIATAATKAMWSASGLNSIENKTNVTEHPSTSEEIEMDQLRYRSLFEEICDLILYKSLGGSPLFDQYEEDGNSNGNEGGSELNPPNFIVEGDDVPPNYPDVPRTPPSKDTYVLNY